LGIIKKNIMKKITEKQFRHYLFYVLGEGRDHSYELSKKYSPEDYLTKQQFRDCVIYFQFEFEKK